MSPFRSSGTQRNIIGETRHKHVDSCASPRTAAFITCAIVSAFVLLSRFSSKFAYGGVLFKLFPPRQPSFPLITGDGFRAYAQHICESSDCDVITSPGVVNCGDIVFVKTDFALALLESWSRRQHTAGTSASNIIILSHNGDIPFTSQHVSLLDRLACISTWFAQNIERGVRHGRLRALPIGLENRQYEHGTFAHAYSSLRALHQFKARMAVARALADAVAGVDSIAGAGQRHHVDLMAALHSRILLLAFNTDTNVRERSRAAELVGPLDISTVTVAGYTHLQNKQLPDMTQYVHLLRPWLSAGTNVSTYVAFDGPGPKFDDLYIPEGLSPSVVNAIASSNPRVAAAFDHMFKTVAKHLFILSPPGNGEQTHRTWETLIAGGIPIVMKSNTVSDSIHRGLPVMQVNAWTDITPLNLLGGLLRLLHCWHNTAGADSRDGTFGSLSGASAADYELFEPALALVPPEKLSPTQRAQLLRCRFDFSKLYIGHWLSAIDTARLA